MPYRRIANTPAGPVRLENIIKTVDGRAGYVMKINSNGTLNISCEPVGKGDQGSVSAKRVCRILWRRRGLMESLVPDHQRGMSTPFDESRSLLSKAADQN